MDTNQGAGTPGGGPAAAANTVTASAPTTGQTQAFAASPVDQVLYMVPAGTIAAQTITLPSDASSRIGQICRFMTRQTITAVVMNGAANIVNPVLTMNAGDSFQFQKVAADTWMRI
jgi:hypothetical protein